MTWLIFPKVLDRLARPSSDCSSDQGLQKASVNEPHHEKTNVQVSDQVQHKPGCTATEDGYRLEIWDLESRGIVLSR